MTILEFLVRFFIIQLFSAHVLCNAVLQNRKTVQFGSTVRLNCTTSLDVYIEWHHNTEFVYVNGVIDDTLQSKYSINSSIRGQYDLVIKNVTAAEAGEYTCIDDAGTGPVIVKYSVNITAAGGGGNMMMSTGNTVSSESEDKSKTAWHIAGPLFLALFLALLLAIVVIIIICVFMKIKGKRDKRTEYKTDAGREELKELIRKPTEVPTETGDDQPSTSADVQCGPKDLLSKLRCIFDKLSELNKQLKDQVKTDGSAKDWIVQQQQRITEFGRALDSLQELINMREEMVKSKDVELQQMKEQLNHMEKDKKIAETELLAAQHKIKTLRDSEAVIERAESSRLSRLHSTEEEKMHMKARIVELEQQLKEMTNAQETVQKEMEKKTSFFEGRIAELLKSLEKIKLEMADIENELFGAQCKLKEQESDKAALQLKYQHVKHIAEQPRKTKEDPENERCQADSALKSLTAAVEALTADMRKQSIQNRGVNAHWDTEQRNVPQQNENYEKSLDKQRRLPVKGEDCCNSDQEKDSSHPEDHMKDAFDMDNTRNPEIDLNDGRREITTPYVRQVSGEDDVDGPAETKDYDGDP